MSADGDDSGLIDFYPYRARFKTYERLEPDGRDRQSIPPLTAKVSQDDILRANDGAFIGLASTY